MREEGSEGGREGVSRYVHTSISTLSIKISMM